MRKDFVIQSIFLSKPVTWDVVKRATAVRMRKKAFGESAEGLSRHDFGNFVNLVSFSNLPQKRKSKPRR